MYSGAERLLFERASSLRKHQTFAEEILWNYLRTKPLGFKFRRQHPFGSYILDFYCHRLKLAIEVDGSIPMQETVKQIDEIRQMQLEREGLSFLRITNNEIRLKPEEVIQKIETYLEENFRSAKTDQI